MPLTIGIVSSQITKELINASYPYVRTSIYGLSANTASLISTYSLTDPTRLTVRWELSSASNPSWITLPGNANNTNVFSYASAQPVNVRSTVLYNLKEIVNTTWAYVKPYSTPADIPNLQLWLDAADSSKTSVGIGGFKDWCWNFNGTNNVISTNSNLPFSILSGNFTIETWLYTSTLPTSFYPLIYQWRQTLGQGGFGFSVLSNGKLIFSFGAYSESVTLVTTSDSISINTWNHVAVTRSGSSFTIFINGISSGTATFTGTRSALSVPITIGHYLNSSGNFPAANGQYFNGHLSNFRIISGTALYTSNFTPPTSPLTNVAGTQILTLQNPTLINNGSASVSFINTGATAVSPNDVTTWIDNSINVRNASQTNPLNRPNLLPTEINGLNALNFDGTNHFLTLNTSISASPFTHFAVYRRNQQNIVTTSLGRRSVADTSLFLQFTDNNMYSGSTKTSTVSNTGVNVVGIRRNESLYLNQTNIPFVGGWPGSNNTLYDTVGSFGSYSHNGALGEIIHTTCMLPNEEILQVNNALQNKWMNASRSPFVITTPLLSIGTSTSAISSTLGTWAISPSSYAIEWQTSTNNISFTSIPSTRLTTPTSNIISVYNPTTADYGLFVRTSVSATNTIGTSVTSSNVLQLTTVNITPASIQRTTIFTVTAIPGIWRSTLPITLLYQWQVSATNTSGWQNVGPLTTSNTVFLSAYSLSTVNVQVLEQAYNSTLEL